MRLTTFLLVSVPLIASLSFAPIHAVELRGLASSASGNANKSTKAAEAALLAEAAKAAGAAKAAEAQAKHSPSQAPSPAPTDAPTDAPTVAPTDAPTEHPTSAPTDAPTEHPTSAPTDAPTDVPTEHPTSAPTDAPTEHPTEVTCSDGNACRRQAVVNGVCHYVDENGSPDICPVGDDSCVAGLINCNDNDWRTLDTCSPSRGCSYYTYSDNTADLDRALTDFQEAEFMFYQEEPTLSPQELKSILDWLKLEVTKIRTPFCWKDSYGRGVGEVLSACPEGKEKIGALCYSKCPAGYSRFGFDCHQTCKAGYVDMGLTCMGSYGRGGGYGWIPFAASQQERCENDHGVGNCEWWGAVIYPKCAEGFHNVLCCFCEVNVDCTTAGYNGGVGASCHKHIIIGDPTTLWCEKSLEQSGALCYPRCKEGYYGEGPVCWQNCDANDLTDCGAACATTFESCASNIFNQVFSVFVLAANVATLGATQVPASTAGAIKIGSTFYTFTNKMGRALGWFASKMTLPVEKLYRGAKLVSVYGTKLRQASSFYGPLVGISGLVQRAILQDFEDITSRAIKNTVWAHLNENDALLVAGAWANIQRGELAGTEAWNGAIATVSIISIFDPTGIVAVVGAYLKPKCFYTERFPVCKKKECGFAQ